MSTEILEVEEIFNADERLSQSQEIKATVDDVRRMCIHINVAAYEGGRRAAYKQRFVGPPRTVR